MNTVNAAWHEYERRVVPVDASHTQKIECRRAFFRGSGVILDLLQQLDDHRATESDKVLAIEAAASEVRQFRLEVMADRA